MTANTGSAALQPAVVHDPFYEYYKHRGFAVELLGPVIPMVVLAVIGLFGNVSVAAATWRTRQVPLVTQSLNGACNYLLAIGGLCDSMHQVSHFIFLYIIATGTNFIPYPLCTKLQAVPLAGLNYGLLMTLFVGVDRLFSMFFPMMHRSLDKAYYVGCFLLFGALYNAFWFYHIFSYAATHSDLEVGCVIPDTMPAYVGSMWFTGCVTINVLTVLCYATVWIAILKMGQLDDKTQRVFKSLSVIMAIVVGGWTVSAIDRIVLLNSKIDPFYFYFIANYFGIPINVACASHFFVLYTFR